MIIAAATPTSSKEADLPFGRMGTERLEPVYGIYPVQPVGAYSCRRTRQKSLGDLYVYKVRLLLCTLTLQGFTYKYKIGCIYILQKKMFALE